MAIVVQFVKDYAPWVYGVCALIALWYLRVAFMARRERRFAVFALEKEAALNRTYAAWTVAFILLSVMGVVYVTSTYVSDAVRPLVEADNPSTPTPQLVAVQVTATATLPLPPPSDVTPTATPGRAPTAKPKATGTPAAPPTATPAAAPVAAAVEAPRCPDGHAMISSPGLNAVVSGMVPIVGTAVNEKFKYYKLEFGAGTNPGVWSYFAGGEKPVQAGLLGTLNSGALSPGTYSIRVVVVDVTGNYPTPCQTIININ
jgi:hypothetical protein